MNNKKLLFVELNNEIDEFRFIYVYDDIVYQYDCTNDYWHVDKNKLKASTVQDKIRLFELEMAGSNLDMSDIALPKELYYEIIKAVFERGI